MAQVQRWARRPFRPLVVFFARRQDAAKMALRFDVAVKMFGFGVGVHLNIRDQRKYLCCVSILGFISALAGG